MKIEPEKMERVDQVIETEIENDLSGQNGSGGQSDSESDEFYFEIDPEVLVDQGLQEAFEWLKEKKGIVISDRKRKVTSKCYSLTLQQLLKQKKLKPWQGSLIMTAVVGIDILRQARAGKNQGGGSSEQD